MDQCKRDVIGAVEERRCMGGEVKTTAAVGRKVECGGEGSHVSHTVAVRPLRPREVVVVVGGTKTKR